MKAIKPIVLDYGRLCTCLQSIGVQTSMPLYFVADRPFSNSFHIIHGTQWLFN